MPLVPSPKKQRREINLNLQKFTERRVVRIMLGIQSRLVARTPVDTGWARANWIPNVGRPIRSTVGSRDAVTQGWQQAGTAQVLGYKLKSGKDIFITNYVPYIGDLNDGSSSKAPAGFVQAAVTGGVNAARRS